MTGLFLAVFIASLLGSLHCAGMCGAFLAIAVGGDRCTHLQTQSAYHAGRLATYLMLGAIAGGLGRLVDLAGALAGLQPIALTLAAATTIAFALVTWLRSRGISVWLFQPPRRLARFVGAVHRLAMNRRPGPRALIIGLSTTLLPCGWLYAFAAVAAGTASSTLGAAVMLAFWFGTLPVMAAIGIGVRNVLGLASARMQALSCVALLGVGLFTIVSRANLSPVRLIARIESSGKQPSQLDAAIINPPPCCQQIDDHSH